MNEMGRNRCMRSLIILFLVMIYPIMGKSHQIGILYGKHFRDNDRYNNVHPFLSLDMTNKFKMTTFLNSYNKISIMPTYNFNFKFDKSELNLGLGAASGYEEEEKSKNGIIPVVISTYMYHFDKNNSFLLNFLGISVSIGYGFKF